MKKILAKVFYPLVLLSRFLSSKFYDLQVWLKSKFSKNKEDKISRKSHDKIKDLIFYVALWSIPFIMFVLTNIVINGNSILLAFQKYENRTVVFAGFENFAYWFDVISEKWFVDMFSRSFLVYIVGMAMTIPSTFTSYYVYKKYLGWKVFKVILFLPTILSSIITVSMFKTVANRVVPTIAQMLTGKTLSPLLTNPHTSLGTLLFYQIWMGIGSGLLTSLAAMNSIDPAVSESAQIEGVGFCGELWHIVLPGTFQIFMLGLITGFAGIFTNSLNLYAFSGTGAPEETRTIGYHITIATLEANYYDYPVLSAWGLLVTFIVTPLTLLGRHLLIKYGPSED